jgi:hypothetical protein
MRNRTIYVMVYKSFVTVSGITISTELTWTRRVVRANGDQILALKSKLTGSEI